MTYLISTKSQELWPTNTAKPSARGAPTLACSSAPAIALPKPQHKDHHPSSTSWFWSAQKQEANRNRMYSSPLIQPHPKINDAHFSTVLLLTSTASPFVE